MMTKMNEDDWICPTCHSHLPISNEKFLSEPKFCLYCGSLLKHSNQISLSAAVSNPHIANSSVSIIAGQAPSPDKIQFSIGPYQILDSIGKGGMGEVFLAYDTTCGRQIALKKVRTDLLDHKILSQRFLKEARITSQLTHPAIIPIYSIHQDDDIIY